MKKGFLTKITYTRGLLISGILILAISVLRDILFPPHVNSSEILSGLNKEEFSFLNLINAEQFLSNLLPFRILRFVNLVIVALLLHNISSEFRLVRVRSFFSFFLFCLFSAIFIPFLPVEGITLSCLIFCLSITRLLSALGEGAPYKALFEASLLMSLTSLFQIKLVFLIPVMWLIVTAFRGISVRSFLSTVLGAACVYWIVAVYIILSGKTEYFDVFVNAMLQITLPDFNRVSVVEVVYLIFMSILIISALISFWPKSHLDKLITRNHMNSIIIILLSLIGIWLFSNNSIELLLIIFCLLSLITAHYFSLVDTRFSRVMFILLIAFSLLFYFLF